MVDSVNLLKSDETSLLRASRSAANDASPGRLSPSERAKWDLAVMQEMAIPGRAQFIPVWDGRGDPVDLVCAIASPTVARLYGYLDGAPVGCRLSSLLSKGPDSEALLRTYLDVASTGRPREFFERKWAASPPAPVLHSIRRLQRNVVEAELVVPTALERARQARIRLWALAHRPP